MASYCGTWSVVAHLDDGQLIALPLSCKSWSCPRCQRRNRRLLSRRLEHTPVHSLLTLTCDPRRYSSFDDAFRAMSNAIPHLFKRLRRLNTSAPIEYFLIWERTKAGWPHCHLLLRAPYIPQPLLSRLWKDLTGAPIVDIRSVSGPHATTSYIAKYLGKDPVCPPGFRRYRCSRRFLGPLTALPPSYDTRVTHWTIEPLPSHALGVHWSLQGLTCRLTPDGTVRAFPRGHPNEPTYDSFTLHLPTAPNDPRLRLWTDPTPLPPA